LPISTKKRGAPVFHPAGCGDPSAKAQSHPEHGRGMSARSRHSVDPPILIVEDKDSLRTMLRHALEAQGTPSSKRAISGKQKPPCSRATPPWCCRTSA
jgi:hypothetical protein